MEAVLSCWRPNWWNVAYRSIPPREKQTPEAFAAFHKAEVDKWWPFIKSAGIKAE
jgi:hypothetical protein